MTTTWATNCYLPGVVGRKFRNSRIVALSTGNVYALSQVAGGGSCEDEPPCPVGEYGMSALGRERVFEYVGPTGLSVRGPITGRHYRFPATGSTLAVDGRDAPSLMAVPNLRPLP